MKRMTGAKAATYSFAAIVLSIIGILVVPLPPFILDALLSFNILFAGLCLLLSITVQEPLEFAAFAPALLIATLFRLSLDVSATRLILTDGNKPGGVGEVIPAFGEFVVRGNLIVGLIIFIILITIQFLVIASGSGRVAEVAARFTLDAMPGKQMSVDADVHAGQLTQDQARVKRLKIQKEAEFYGAMDGAGKFVKGDAIAALIIVILNLIGGLAIGVLMKHMAPMDALNTYAILTIGNALVTTLPAFLMSTCMGLLVTRAAGDGSLGLDLSRQLVDRPEVLRAASAFATVLALVPALPHFVFAALAIGGFWLSNKKAKEAAAIEESANAVAAKQSRSKKRRPENSFELVGVEAITVAFGTTLAMQLLSDNVSDVCLDRLNDMRREIARETGVVLPGIHLRDDQFLGKEAYSVFIRDELRGQGTLRSNHVLALATKDVLAKFVGEETREPVYGLPAKWIAEGGVNDARSKGAMTFDVLSVLASHVGQIAREHLSTICGRQEFAALLDHLKTKAPVVIKDIGTDVMPVQLAHRAFTYLLRESVWPRDPIAAIEAMLEAAETTRDPAELAEAARKRLVPALLRRRQQRSMQILMLDPEFEAEVSAQWNGHGANPDPRIAVHIRDAMEKYTRSMPKGQAIMLCTAGLRRALAELAMRSTIALTVYAFNEVPGDLDVRPTQVVNSPFAGIDPEPEAVNA